jgi:hypothetical protein
MRRAVDPAHPHPTATSAWSTPAKPTIRPNADSKLLAVLPDAPVRPSSGVVTPNAAPACDIAAA